MLQVAGQIETPPPSDPIMRRPCADREEKRVTHGKGRRHEEQLDPDNPNQRGLLETASIIGSQSVNEAHQRSLGRGAFGRYAPARDNELQPSGGSPGPDAPTRSQFAFISYVLQLSYSGVAAYRYFHGQNKRSHRLEQ